MLSFRRKKQTSKNVADTTFKDIELNDGQPSISYINQNSCYNFYRPTNHSAYTIKTKITITYDHEFYYIKDLNLSMWRLKQIQLFTILNFNLLITNNLNIQDTNITHIYPKKLINYQQKTNKDINNYNSLHQLRKINIAQGKENQPIRRTIKGT